MRKQLSWLVLLCLPGLAAAEFPKFLTADIEWSKTTNRLGVPKTVAGLPSVDEVIAVIGLNPGFSIRGLGQNAKYLDLAPRGATQINFPLYLLEPIASQLAQTHQQTDTNDEIIVAPADAKLLWVITGFVKNQSDKLHDGYFMNESTGEIYYLIYVDQPCRITGTKRRRGTPRLYYDLSFENAGFHWIQVMKDREQTFRNVAIPSKVVFSHSLFR